MKKKVRKLKPFKNDEVTLALDGYGVFIQVNFNGCQAWTRVCYSDAKKIAKSLVELSEYGQKREQEQER